MDNVMHKGNERAAHKWKKEIVDGGETALGTPQKKHFAFSLWSLIVILKSQFDWWTEKCPVSIKQWSMVISHI